MAQQGSSSPPPNLREVQRLQRALENAKSPLLKLPAEIRNRVYELCLTHGEVFNTGSLDSFYIKGVEKDRHTYVSTIQTSDSYKHHFGITQVCSQLRKETIKMWYSGSIFMLQVVGPKGATTARDGRVDMGLGPPAEDWLSTRAPEALHSLHEVILQYYGIDDELISGMDMVLFEPRLKTYKIISEACLCECEKDDIDHERVECDWCYEHEGRSYDFKDVLKEASRGPTHEGAAGKLYTLIEIFRDTMLDRLYWWSDQLRIRPKLA